MLMNGGGSIFKCHHWLVLATAGDARCVHSLRTCPLSIQFLSFSCTFQQKYCQIIGFCPKFSGWRHHVWENWIRHCKRYCNTIDRWLPAVPLKPAIRILRMHPPAGFPHLKTSTTFYPIRINTFNVVTRGHLQCYKIMQSVYFKINCFWLSGYLTSSYFCF